MATVSLLLLAACNGPADDPRAGEAVVTDTLMRVDSAAAYRDSMPADGTAMHDTALQASVPGAGIDTKQVKPAELVAFAQTMTGTPYVYGSTNPKVGFDCSGFITYVFNHFGIQVPRSSIDFTQVGATVDTLAAQPGDLILFTGTNHLERHVGHMGIITGREGSVLQFIHSTSGKAMGVTTTPLNDYYKQRFVRVARVFGPAGRIAAPANLDTATTVPKSISSKAGTVTRKEPASKRTTTKKQARRH